MKFDDGKLRAYLDQALSAEEMVELKQQLASSPEAQARLTQLRQEQQDAARYLAALAPSDQDSSSSPGTRQQFRAHRSGQLSSNKPLSIRERIGTMSQKSMIKWTQPAIIVLTVVTLIAIGLSFAPVRTMAGNLLRMFRVQTVRVIPVDSEDMAALRENPNLERLVGQLEPQLEVIDNDEPQEVESLDEAADLAGFEVAKITAVPEDAGEWSISVAMQKVVRLQLDRDLLAAVFEAAEIEVDLPDSLDEEPVIITQPDTVIQSWYRNGEETLRFVQLPAPTVSYPDGLDLNALGVASLQLLGLSRDQAEGLGATIDWANTMVLPVPSDAITEIEEVRLPNGGEGLVFSSPDADNDEATIMWTLPGMSYLIRGDYGPEMVKKIAGSAEKIESR